MLRLVGERDRDGLLKSVCDIAREMVSAEYASVGIFHRDGGTIRGLAWSGKPGTEAFAPPFAVLQPGHLADMLLDRQSLRLSRVSAESLGFDLPSLPTHIASLLCVPLLASTHIRGWLLLGNKLDSDTFNETDEQTAVALASDLALAYERLEDQERADEGLADSRDLAESMFEYAPDAIVAVNEQGRIVKVNAQTLKVFGYTREELIGEFVEILVPERFRAAHPARRQQYSSCPRRRPMGEGLELFGRRKDTSEFPVDIMLSPLETKRGKLMLSVIRDATARKQSETNVRELNRSLEAHVEELQAANQELEAFSYSVSHDLRAPLRQIDGFSRILRERMGPQSDPNSSHYLQRIQDAATHMALLLEGLLNLGRIGRQGLSIRSTDLHPLAAEVIEELKLEHPNRQIEWILEPLSFVQCDRILVKAVFSNLLSNAVKFTRLRECAIIRVSQRVEQGETIISVADNGVGFNMKYLDKLFGIFQRLHRPEDFPGTGIGLATVQRIIQKHGGRIWAEAELNSFARFHFALLPGIKDQVPAGIEVT